MNRVRLGLALIAGLVSIPALSSAAGNAPKPSICDRVCWSARAPKCSISYMSGLNRAIIHHTADANHMNTTGLSDSKANVRGVQNYHMDVNGWCDIGYHFLVDKYGYIFEGRHDSLTKLPKGAHDGVNSNSFGFSLMGYFHTPHDQLPPVAMRSACYDVIAWRMPDGWSPYGSGTYGTKTVGYTDGHRSVKATACPGDHMWQYIGTDYNGGEARNEIKKRIDGATTIVVDNANSGFSCSSNWSTGTSAGDKYGTDYRYRSTAAVSDAANFTASLPSTGNYDVSAWWTAGTNRSASAPYILPDGSTVSVNQQVNGGKWNLLGTKSLSGGNNTTKLSCWTTTGYVVIADAVKYYGPK